jgi:hypothetical protein
MIRLHEFYPTIETVIDDDGNTLEKETFKFRDFQNYLFTYPDFIEFDFPNDKVKIEGTWYRLSSFEHLDNTNVNNNITVHCDCKCGGQGEQGEQVNKSAKEIDLSPQLDGVNQVFKIDHEFGKEYEFAAYYAGQRLVEGTNYVLNPTNSTITTTFSKAPDTQQGRRLIVTIR